MDTLCHVRHLWSQWRTFYTQWSPCGLLYDKAEIADAAKAVHAAGKHTINAWYIKNAAKVHFPHSIIHQEKNGIFQLTDEGKQRLSAQKMVAAH